MRTALKVLLAASTVALAFACTAAAGPPGAPDYPWVQPPAWVGTGVVGAVPAATASQPGVQPPAWIPIVTPIGLPAIAGSSYQWVQLPAWVGTGKPPTPLTAPSYPWHQPPASVPIG